MTHPPSALLGRDFNLPFVADDTSIPNANAYSPGGVIAASISADFTNISNSSISVGRFSTWSASTTTPQNPTTGDNNIRGIERVSGC
eukprot:scaffold60014_cov74-Cyclotella_meneghiniana.AAC.3